MTTRAAGTQIMAVVGSIRLLGAMGIASVSQHEGTLILRSLGIHSWTLSVVEC